VTSNSGDANAHYLLGTLLFSKGLYDEALTQWTKAKRINPTMPVLDADMGKAFLYVKGDSGRAVTAFRDGTKNDPANAANYAGLDRQ
jgi:tetratricopeptide (TPR) repeat protein